MNDSRRHRLSQALTSDARSTRVFLVAVQAIVAFAAWAFMAGGLLAQDDDTMTVSRENRIKATYLYQLGLHVEWPDSVYTNSESPFVIGILGNDPIFTNLEELAQLKTIQNHPIRIVQYSSPLEIHGCQILFIPSSVSAEEQAKAIQETAGRPVLLVGDGNDFISRGGGMGFIVEENKIRLTIAKNTTERQGLIVRSRLLQVAHVVE